MVLSLLLASLFLAGLALAVATNLGALLWLLSVAGALATLVAGR